MNVRASLNTLYDTVARITRIFENSIMSESLTPCLGIVDLYGSFVILLSSTSFLHQDEKKVRIVCCINVEDTVGVTLRNRIADFRTYLCCILAGYTI